MTNHPYREFVLFSMARRMPSGQRATYLEKACLGNLTLRQHVEELLQANEQAGTFLQDSAPGAAAHWPRVRAYDPQAVESCMQRLPGGVSAS